MSKKLMKKSLVMFLTFVMIIGQVGFIPTRVSAASDEDFEIVSPRITNRDVILSVSPNSSISLGELQDELRFIDAVDAIRINTTNIDTTDLSSWNVYDHYDTQYWPGGKTQWLNETGYNERLRPWYPYTETQATENSTNSNNNCKTEATTIHDLEGTKHWGYSAKLKEHIFAENKAGKAYMTFYGYGGPTGNGFTDFLYYPADTGSVKNVNFQVNANDVQLHSLTSSGFLFNCSVNASDQLNGYAIVFLYNGPTGANQPINAIDRVCLLKLTNVSLATLHTSTATSNRGLVTVTRSGEKVSNVTAGTTGVSLLQTTNLSISDSNFAGKYDLSDVSLTIKKDSLLATMSAKGANASGESVKLFDINSTSGTITNSGSGGFGPFIQYASHNCGATSSYRFSDLNMSITTTSSLLDAFSNADYTQKTAADASGEDSKKYFIVIGDNTSGSKDQFALNTDDVFLELIKKENVVLITNIDIETLNGSNTNSDYNLADYLGEDNIYRLTSTTAEGMAAEIEALVTQNEYNVTSASTSSNAFEDTNQTTPGANCYVTYKGYQADTVKRNKVPAEGITLTVESTGLTVNPTASITYTLTKPNGDKVTQTDNPNFVIPETAKTDDTNWPSGTYTITMSYGDEDGIKGITYFDLEVCYDVSFNGVFEPNGTENDHVSLINNGSVGVNAAKEKTTYTTKLIADNGYTLPATITVTEGQNTLTSGTDYTYNPSTGEITINANKVTGTIAITASGVKKQYSVTVNGDHITPTTGTTGDNKATYQEEYTTTITAESGYGLPASITVEVGSKTLTAGTDYQYNKNTGALTIPAAKVDGNITIQIEAMDIGTPEAVINIDPDSWNQETVDFNAITYYDETKEIEITASDDEGSVSDIYYYITDTPAEDSSAITDWTEYDDNDRPSLDSDGTYIIYVKAVDNSGNETIINTGILVIDTTAPAFSGVENNGTYYGDKQVTIHDDNLKTLTLDGQDITLDEDGRYLISADNSEHTIVAVDESGNTTTYIITVYEKYDVEHVGSHVSALEGTTGSKKALYQQEYTTQLSASSGYTLPTTITVTVGQSTLTSDTDYTYNSSTGEITVNANKVTGTIAITASGVKEKYSVVLNGENITAQEGTTGANKATYQEEYTTTITANAGYGLPPSITIQVGSKTLTAGTDYQYNKDTGALTIPASNVDGNITIGIEAKDTGAPSAVITIDPDSWNQETVDFDTITYYDETKVIEIDASDDEGSVSDIYYYITDTPSEDSSTIADWTKYDDNNKPSLDENGTYIAYAKAVDDSGNETIINTGIIVIDKNAPALSGIEDDGTYYGDKQVTINEDNLKTLTLDGKDITLDEDGKYLIPADNKEHTIVAVDKSGNTTTYTITVYEKYDVTLIGSHVSALDGTTGTEKALYQQAYTTQLNAASGYTLPATITVVVGQSTLTSVTDYTYNSSTGEITINANKVTGTIAITASGVKEKYSVELNGENITAQEGTTGANKATYQEEYTTIITANAGYGLPPSITIQVGSKTLTSGTDYQYNKDTGTLTIPASNVDGNITISIESKDTSTPSAVITIDPDSWNQETVDFDTITYYDETKVIEIDASDDEGSVSDIYYYITDTPSEDSSTIADWTKYDNNKKPSLDENGAYIVYTKAVDDAGNETIINTGIIVIDKTAPALSGIEDDGTYYGDKQVTIYEDNLKTLTLDGKDITLDKDGKYLVPADNKEHTIVAVDKSGNTTTYTITVYEKYDVTLIGSHVSALDGTTGTEKALYQQAYTTQLNAASGYTLPTTITVTVGQSTLTSDTEYTYNANTGIITIPAGKVIGAIQISAVGKAVPINSEQPAPATSLFQVTDAQYKDSADGKISGLTTAMEYSKDGGKTWIRSNGKPISNLIAGDYLIRYAASNTKRFSTPTKVKVNFKSQELNIPTIYTSKMMGKKQKFQITLPNIKGATVSCYSSNPKVATISKKGLVKTSTKLGKTEVVISIVKGSHKVQYVMPLTVKKEIKKNYSLAKFKTSYKHPSIALYKLMKKNQKWKIKITHKNRSTKLSYKSNKKSVAVVNKKGIVKAKKLGKAIITVTVKQNGIKDKYFIVIRATDGKKKSDTSYLKVIK